MIFSPRSPVSPISPTPSCSTSRVSDGSHSRVQSKTIEIPKLWKPDVEDCIQKESLTDSVRDEIVRHLVNILFSKTSKPIRSDCEELSRRLILTYPWMKDDMGSGYVRFCLLYFCCYDANLL